MFNVFYKKNNNKKIFNSLEKVENMNISNIQNYIPLYNNFFDINEKNYNIVNLNNKYSLDNLLFKNDELSYTVNVKNDKGDDFKKECF